MDYIVCKPDSILHDFYKKKSSPNKWKYFEIGDVILTYLCCSLGIKWRETYLSLLIRCYFLPNNCKSSLKKKKKRNYLSKLTNCCTFCPFNKPLGVDSCTGGVVIRIWQFFLSSGIKATTKIFYTLRWQVLGWFVLTIWALLIVPWNCEAVLGTAPVKVRLLSLGIWAYNFNLQCKDMLWLL